MRHLEQTKVCVQHAVRAAHRLVVAFAERWALDFGVDFAGTNSRARAVSCSSATAAKITNLFRFMVAWLLFPRGCGRFRCSEEKKTKVRRSLQWRLHRNELEKGSQVLGLIIRDQVSDGTDTDKAKQPCIHCMIQWLHVTRHLQ